MKKNLKMPKNVTLAKIYSFGFITKRHGIMIYNVYYNFQCNLSSSQLIEISLKHFDLFILKYIFVTF